MISAPVIREPILGGSGQISGSFTVQSANDLAILLRAGALPAPLTIIEERTVGPGLGADSIAKGKISFLAVTLGALSIGGDARSLRRPRRRSHSQRAPPAGPGCAAGHDDRGSPPGRCRARNPRRAGTIAGPSVVPSRDCWPLAVGLAAATLG